MNKKSSGITLSFAVFGLLLVGMFTSCSNLERRLPKQEGTWNLVSEHRLEIINGEVVNDSSQVDVGTIQFNKDGTGQKWFSADTANIQWSFNKQTDQITIIQQNINFIYNVLENNPDSQTWQNVAEIEASGTTSRVETTWDLKR